LDLWFELELEEEVDVIFTSNMNLVVWLDEEWDEFDDWRYLEYEIP